MKRTLFVVATAVFALLVACKKDSATGSTATTGSASGASASLSGDCKFVVDKPQCQPGGKAAFCGMSHDGKMKVSWMAFSCPDCAATDKGVRCSAFTVGEPCDMLATTSAQCSKDGKSELSCDMATHVWTSKPCAGGCTGDMEKGLSCN
jgi:hypothetical protein